MQTRSVNKYIFFFLISVFNAATVSADNLDAGKKAYLDYDFDSAVKIFEPFIFGGSREAKFASIIASLKIDLNNNYLKIFRVSTSEMHLKYFV